MCLEENGGRLSLLMCAALKSLNCALTLKTEKHYPAFHSASPSLLTIHRCYWEKGHQLLVGTFWENVTALQLFSSIKLKFLGVGSTTLLHSKKLKLNVLLIFPVGNLLAIN